MSALREQLRRLELPQPVRHALAYARGRWAFRHANLGDKVLVNGPIRVDARGRLTIADCVSFISGIVPCELVVHEGAVLSIGEGCTFNYGVTLEARAEVRIGRRCLFGSHVRLSDAVEGVARPIVLGDDVWVAHGAVISPGVEVGDGAVVAAGSVVTQSVPPRMMAMGNPARISSLALTSTTERT